jgi:hypothetical protein
MAVERIAFLLLILEVQGSNLCPKAVFPEAFRHVLQSVQSNIEAVLKKTDHSRFFPDPFQFLIHQLPCHSVLCNVSC